MDVKKLVVKAVAPMALGTANQTHKRWASNFILNQPKLPKKLMNTVK